MKYNWQLPQWPDFTFDQSLVHDWLTAAGQELTAHSDKFLTIPEDEHPGIYLATTVEEGVQSSSIEGEDISRAQVQSSLIDNVYFGAGNKPVADVRARGLARLLAAMLRAPEIPLSEILVRHWHEVLFSGQPYPGSPGNYRSGTQPMRIVGGPDYSPTVHFEAPPAASVPRMMKDFITSQQLPLPILVRTGIGHLHFESIHPFSDGNGRIGRAIMERQILGLLGGRPLLSISHAIRMFRSDYYAALKQAQRTLDLTAWLEFFFSMLSEAVRLSDELIQFTLRKTHYFNQFQNELTPSEEKVLRRMWAAGPAGFRGGMTPKKYVRLTRVSPATATRSLARLTRLGALTRHGGGRSTHYRLLAE